MSEQEIEFLREDIKEICAYKGLQEELTYDVPLEILKRICRAIDFLKQENSRLKESIAYLERSNERKEETIIDYKINEYLILEELKKWSEEKIQHNIPNARWKHYNEDGFHDYDIVGASSIKIQPVNITFKEVLDKVKELEEGVK